MLEKQLLYHGSEIKRAERILKENQYISSEGDRHWLGDGIYFYPDKFLAYRWIWNMYKKSYGEVPSNFKLFTEYGILKSEVNFPKERVYNLKEVMFQVEFNKIRKILLDKSENNDRLSKEDIIDGTVINIMFNNLGYGKDYDVVIALFSINKDNLEDYRLRSRIWYSNEEQICVKNKECIISIDILEPGECEHFYSLIKETFEQRYYVKKKKSMYKS